MSDGPFCAACWASNVLEEHFSQTVFCILETSTMVLSCGVKSAHLSTLVSIMEHVFSSTTWVFYFCCFSFKTCLTPSPDARQFCVLSKTNIFHHLPTRLGESCAPRWRCTPNGSLVCLVEASALLTFLDSCMKMQRPLMKINCRFICSYLWIILSQMDVKCMLHLPNEAPWSRGRRAKPLNVWSAIT